MAVLRAQTVLQGKSNKPEDVFVNTWHFDSASTGPAAAAVVRDHLVEFFNTATTGTPSGAAIAGAISNVVSRAANACKVKVYDLADPEPRIPIEFAWTMGANEGGTVAELPAEVALCASFYAGVNRPRTRGRVYLGPWSIGYTVDDTVLADRAIPTVDLRNRIAGALKRLIAKPANTQNLAVYSTVDNVARIVTNGWVDDAWDTQRRRGQAATARVLVP